MNNRFYSKYCTDNLIKLPSQLFFFTQNENATSSVFVFSLCSVPFRFFFAQTMAHVNNWVCSWKKCDWWHLCSVKWLPVLSDFHLLVSLQWEGKRTQLSISFSSKGFKIRRIHNCIFSASLTSFLCLFKCTLQIFLLFNDLLLCTWNNTASNWFVGLHSLCKLLLEGLFLFIVLEYSTIHPLLRLPPNLMTLALHAEEKSRESRLLNISFCSVSVTDDIFGFLYEHTLLNISLL